MSRTRLAAAILLILAASAPVLQAQAVPPGAAELGYTRCVINEHPTTADIAPGRQGNYKWFSGQWYASAPPSLDHYATLNGTLALSLGGDLVSAPQDFSASKLPLLPGADGFYVEFDVRLSDNDPDHWPAVWLMPVEHGGKQTDHYEGDPASSAGWSWMWTKGALGRASPAASTTGAASGTAIRTIRA